MKEDKRQRYMDEMLSAEDCLLDELLSEDLKDDEEKDLMERLAIVQCGILSMLKLKEKLDALEGRCPVMLKNAFGMEQCGRKRGHEGRCCYERGD